MIKAIYFDLFFTLIIPSYDKANNEFDILGLTMSKWEKYAEDGGSEELYGAKSAGMKTVFTEALETKSSEKRNSIMAYADYHVNRFAEILDCI